MREVVLDMLPFAVGIAISPVPIITVILMLFTDRPAANGPLFLLGWFLGIGLPALVFIEAGTAMYLNSETAEPSALASGLRVVAGVVLILLAVRNWWRRSLQEDALRKPMLMKMVDVITPWKAVLIGFLFADVTNPKNLALTVAGCMSIIQGQLDGVSKLLMVLVFTFIASLGIGLPVLLFLAGGEAARQVVTRWKSWLMRHKHGVMAALFMVFGIVLLVKGLRN